MRHSGFLRVLILGLVPLTGTACLRTEGLTYATDPGPADAAAWDTGLADARAADTRSIDTRGTDTRPGMDAISGCTENGVAYPVGAVIARSTCTICMCLSTGQVGDCADTCSPDAGSDAAPAATLCTSTKGTVNEARCCESASDFPNTCQAGACGCAPIASRRVQICTCQNGCFDPAFGCVGPPNVCMEGMDQTCNASLAISSLRGRCVTGGRCLCTLGKGLSSSGKCL